MDALGQELLGLGDEAGQGVEVDGGITEPVGGAQAGRRFDRVVEDVKAVVAGDGAGSWPGGPGAEAGGS